MAIDMTTVKQIMHNNKEVAKIEDGLGNILWQKQSAKYLYKVSITYTGPISLYDKNGNSKTLTATMYSETPLSGTNVTTGNFRTELVNAGLITASNASSFNVLSFVDEPETGYFVSVSGSFRPVAAVLANGVRYIKATSPGSSTLISGTSTYTYSSALVQINSDTLLFGAVNQVDTAGTAANLGWASRMYSTTDTTFDYTTDYGKLQVTNLISNASPYNWVDPTNITITGYSTGNAGTYTFSNGVTKYSVNTSAYQTQQVMLLHPFTI